MNQPLLELRNLTKHYPLRGGTLRRETGLVRALEGVDLRVGRGETVALVGESGCGKSTLARTLLRLEEPTSGSVLYWPEAGAGPVDLASLGQSELRRYRRDLQILFQDPHASLNPRMTVGQAIGEVLQVHGLGGSRARPSLLAERTQRVAELLAMVGLTPELSGRFPFELSGGQRQRVSIARALAVEPQLLVCDEALSALDVSLQAQILGLLSKLSSELGLSYLFISHDLAVVRHVAERVAVLYLGKIVEEGTVSQLFENPQHPYTRALLSAIPRLDPDARSARVVLRGEPGSAADLPSGCAFHPRCPVAEASCALECPTLQSAPSGQRVACPIVATPSATR